MHCLLWLAFYKLFKFLASIVPIIFQDMLFNLIRYNKYWVRILWNYSVLTSCGNVYFSLRAQKKKSYIKFPRNENPWKRTVWPRMQSRSFCMSLVWKRIIESLLELGLKVDPYKRLGISTSVLMLKKRFQWFPDPLFLKSTTWTNTRFI